MAVQRHVEYRLIDNRERAGLCRKSFQRYSEKSLLASGVFYALTSVFFCGIFLIKYRVELVLAMPFLCGIVLSPSLYGLGPGFGPPEAGETPQEASPAVLFRGLVAARSGADVHRHPFPGSPLQQDTDQGALTAGGPGAQEGKMRARRGALKNFNKALAMPLPFDSLSPLRFMAWRRFCLHAASVNHPF